MSAISRFDPVAELSDNVRTKFYIGGQWRTPASRETLELVSPVTEEITLRVPAGMPADMDAAVKAARQAFDRGEWPRLSPQQRGACLERLAGELRKREDILRRLWIAQVGVPRWFADAFTGLGAVYLDYYGAMANTYEFETERKVAMGRAKVVKEPVGVARRALPLFELLVRARREEEPVTWGV